MKPLIYLFYRIQNTLDTFCKGNHVDNWIKQDVNHRWLLVTHAFPWPLNASLPAASLWTTSRPRPQASPTHEQAPPTSQPCPWTCPAHEQARVPPVACSQDRVSHKEEGLATRGRTCLLGSACFSWSHISSNPYFLHHLLSQPLSLTKALTCTGVWRSSVSDRWSPRVRSHMCKRPYEYRRFHTCVLRLKRERP